ncbi:MAG: hypothetical protein IJ461_08215, partial [Clostridia bacterium]|nr:hypothetical protein [Clostridia bacterium]
AQPDMVERMNYLFMNDQNWISIYRPEELTAAITDAIYAKDDAAKVEAIMRADKVMIDDYCLIIPTFSATDTSVANPKVHDTNISSSAPATAWTPEQAWIEQ